jgi:hypothetical protein
VNAGDTLPGGGCLFFAREIAGGAMPVPPESFRLPEEFASAGDPVDGNPFSADDSRHKVWKDETRKAEEEVCRLNMTAMSSLRPDNVESWLPWLITATFNAWAKRNVKVVWCDRDVERYGGWLVGYANECITVASRHLPPGLPRVSAESQLLDIRNKLGERVQYWKALARRFREELEQEVIKMASAERTPTVTPELKNWRKLTIRKYRDEQNLTAAGLAQKLSTNTTAIRAIAREDWNKFKRPLQKKLLDALGITLADWYRK